MFEDFHEKVSAIRLRNPSSLIEKYSWYFNGSLIYDFLLLDVNGFLSLLFFCFFYSSNLKFRLFFGFQSFSVFNPPLKFRLLESFVE